MTQRVKSIIELFLLQLLFIAIIYFISKIKSIRKSELALNFKKKNPTWILSWI